MCGITCKERRERERERERGEREREQARERESAYANDIYYIPHHLTIVCKNTRGVLEAKK